MLASERYRTRAAAWRGASGRTSCPFIEEKAVADLDRRSEALLDQRAYGRAGAQAPHLAGVANDFDADASIPRRKLDDKTPPRTPTRRKARGKTSRRRIDAARGGR